jgi:hypothetical protein
LGRDADSEFWKHLQTVVQQDEVFGLDSELSRLRDISSRLEDQNSRAFCHEPLLLPEIPVYSKLKICIFVKIGSRAVISKLQT